MRTVADLRRMAKQSGCRLVRTRTIAGELVGEFDCPDILEGRPYTTAQLLEQLTNDDQALDPLDPAIVLAVQSAGTLAAAAALLYVQKHVRFVEDEWEGEEVERFQSPAVTFALGYGDCDDSVRALLALAAAAGVPGRFVFFLQDGQPAHVTLQLFSGGQWLWAEPTIAARLGEHPFAAMRRLRIKRADLDGTPYLIENGVPVPLTAPPPLAKGPAMRLSDASKPRTIRRLRALVPRVATPVTAQALANALAAAWPTVVGGSPGAAIQVLVAHSAFETGQWASMWNNNIGNVKTSTSGSSDYFSMSATEGYGSNVTTQAALWRSYPTLEQGAAGYLAFLNANYNAALQSAIAGDVAGFVSGLQHGTYGAYFTGNPTDYANGVQSYYSAYSALSPNAAAGDAAAVAQTVTSSGAGDETWSDWSTGTVGANAPETLGSVLAGVAVGVLAGLLL